MQELEKLKQELEDKVDKHNKDLESAKINYDMKTSNLKSAVEKMKSAPIIVNYKNNSEFIDHVKGLQNQFENKFTKIISTWHHPINPILVKDANPELFYLKDVKKLMMI